MTACAIHISDLHRGTRPPALDDALVTLCHELRPELVIASGDLCNRGRRAELEQAKALLDRLPAPALAVRATTTSRTPRPRARRAPGRSSRPCSGRPIPVFRTDSAVVCGLNSARPWRHQGGRLGPTGCASRGERARRRPARRARVVVCHHHLAGAPWRASRKFPLKHRDSVLRALAEAGAELVLGGHIHQGSAAERHAFEALAGRDARPLVLATAPGYGRPRPHRLGEANGLNVVRWTPTEIEVETRIWRTGPSRPRLFRRIYRH